MSLFPSQPLPDDDQPLVTAYTAAGRTLDDLPYTPEFEALFASLDGVRSRREVFHRLHNLRKAARLPRLGRASEPAPKITAEDEAILTALIIDQVGTLGQRDQLPFDPRFDTVVQRFSDQTGRALNQRDVWRLVAKLAK